LLLVEIVVEGIQESFELVTVELVYVFIRTLPVENL
jgi:hypothetical protein